MKKRLIVIIFCVGVLLLGAGARAATRTVDTNADDAASTACTAAANDCSLRGAIASAAAGDTVNFDSTVFASPQTITLGGASNPIIIAQNLTVTGPGADKLTVSGNSANLVFDVRDFTVGLSGMTVTGGNGKYFLNNSSAPGGGINNYGTLTVTDCVITGNQSDVTASYGGGIYNGKTLTLVGTTVSNNTARFNAFSVGGGISTAGTLHVINSTFSGNVVASTGGGSHGGGIQQFSGTTVITNSTITDNTVNTNNNSAGGVQVGSGSVTVRNSIIAGNVNNSTYADVRGAFATTGGGNNVVGNVGTASGFAQPGDQTGTSLAPLNPLLGALTVAGGGTTPTHALLANSPAANAGNNCVLTNTCTPAVSIGALSVDQRGAGFPRQYGTTNVDVGAFESALTSSPTAAGVSVSGRVLTPAGRGLMNATVILTDAGGNARAARTSVFGFYRFDEVEAGQTYVFTVSAKRYQFQPQIVTVNEDLSELNFTGK